MTARMRRLLSDYEQVKKDFAGHKNIIVTPVGDDMPEQYRVTYFVNGIYLLPDGRIQTLGRHEIEITLHADYPRYKPICKILTPIWHPNFRDGQICIGDIWGAGESLSDIIVNIGDMIQYKSWNSYSPLCADAAKWAMENKHLFPVGNIDLYIADYASAKDTVEIDLFGDDGNVIEETPTEDIFVDAHAGVKTDLDGILSGKVEMSAPDAPATEETPAAPVIPAPAADENDFEITAEELAGIEFIPTAQRMQTVSHGGTVKGGKINLKTILVKGVLWALIGAFAGFFISELTDRNLTSDANAAKLCGYDQLADYFEVQQKADDAWDDFYGAYETWCENNNYDPELEANFDRYMASGMTDAAEADLDKYLEYDAKAEDALYKAYNREFDQDEDALTEGIRAVRRVATGLWSAVIALFVGLFLGIGEGIYYGSKEKTLMYAAIGAGVSLILGFISGYAAQWMYVEMLTDDAEEVTAAFIRGLGWAIMGIGIGVGVGLIKPETKRILYCAIGGGVGAFIGGFLFNYVVEVIPDDVVARGVAIVVMGILIGVGVGLLEQFAKAAWLKVIRGEFEGKEFLVFAGTTSIGNNGKNTIVLFKDKLVGPHHCDIKLEGGKYILVDCGTPMGTIVNGQRTTRHLLRQGDAIAIGNSVLVFNTK